MTTERTYTPEEKETVYRKNFWYFFIDGILFMVALNMIGSTTLIPDFVRQLTNSEILIGLSGALFTVGFTPATVVRCSLSRRCRAEKVVVCRTQYPGAVCHPHLRHHHVFHGR